MKNLSEFKSPIEYILTDIDDTLTTDGQLHAAAYKALWQLHDRGLKIIPITGRPAGWCEMIARFWPVHGIVGENGGFYFRYAANTGENKKMHRWFFTNEKTQIENKIKLGLIQNEVLSQVPGSAVSSDQFCRMMDLAIDFCEDVPKLPDTEVHKIVSIFEKHGAQAKVSSIHVNGWFGDYNKLSTTLKMLQNEFAISPEDALIKCAFLGDSPNDEPMFEYFTNSIGVANVNDFKNTMQHKPKYICQKRGGEGFAEFTNHLLKIKD